MQVRVAGGCADGAGGRANCWRVCRLGLLAGVQNPGCSLGLLAVSRLTFLKGMQMKVAGGPAEEACLRVRSFGQAYNSCWLDWCVKRFVVDLAHWIRKQRCGVRFFEACSRKGGLNIGF